MRLATLPVSLLLALGCSRSPTERPREPGKTAPPQPTFAPGATHPWPHPDACASTALIPPGDPSVDADLRTIVGGHYSVDHIGPAAYEAIEEHVRHEPDAFLDALGRAALDPAAPLDRHWANVLERTVSASPLGTRELAACLLDRFADALAHPPADRDPSWEDRIRQHQIATYLVWRFRPDDGRWRIATPSSACTTTTEGVTTLTVEVSCTCGEPIACEVAIAPGRLDVLVTVDPRGAVMCDDCYPGTGTCTLPPVPDSDPLMLNGLPRSVEPCARRPV